MRFKILTIALLAFNPALAYAACSDEAAALANKYGITASLTPDSATASTEKLAKSGGVIAPPATGDMAAMPNPEPSIDHMATAPALPAQTANGDTIGKTAKTETPAATDSQAASLLQAARSSGLKGDESACQQSLTAARALLQKTPTQSQ